jgi:dTDP-4-amino-4,6-dideoxygalactose transaminase
MGQELAHRAWPVLTKNDEEAVLSVLRRGVLSGPLAPEVRALEQEFADWLGVKYCLATNSGTSALHMALDAIGVGPGDEVIVPAFTFVATAMAVLQQGARPVFVDIENQSWGMDPACLKSAITSKTKAIIPVHIHGMPCDLGAILEIARQHELKVIEDACQAPGSLYQGQKVGTFGQMAAFSLQSSKNLVCGEGGLLVTNDEALYRQAARFRMFGEDFALDQVGSYDPERPLDLKRSYDSVCLGYMYRTNELSAALARTQLRELDRWNAKALHNAQILAEGLSGLREIRIPEAIAGRKSVYHKYRVRVSDRDRIMGILKEKGLEAVQWQSKTVPQQTVFNKLGYGSTRFPNAENLIQDSFCLFSHTYPLWAQSEELCQHYIQVIRNSLS